VPDLGLPVTMDEVDDALRGAFEGRFGEVVDATDPLARSIA
jgi:hypothetical protein